MKRFDVAVGILLAVCVATGYVLTWHRWPDLQIDFGRELYIPWQLTQGKLLYRDLSHFFGPFASYLVALLFSVFPVSLETLTLFNALVLLFLSYLIHRIFSQVSDRWTSLVTSLSFLVLAGFNHRVVVGNYSFIAPYTHSSTYGWAAAVIMIRSLIGFLSDRRRVWLTLAGLSYGIAFLTKPEIFVAASLALAAWLLFVRERGRALVRFVSLALLVPAAFYVFFRSQMVSADALRATLGAWTPLFRAVEVQSFFLYAQMGLQRPGHYLLLASLGLLGMSAWWGLGIWGERLPKGRFPVRGLLIATVLIVAGAMPIRFWDQAGSGLSLFTLLAWPGFVVLALHSEENSDDRLRFAGLAIWSGFALGLLLRVFLKPRLGAYGSFLVTPAFLAWGVVSMHTLPKLLRGNFLRYLSLALIAGFLFAHGKASWANYRLKNAAIASAGDRLYGFSGGPVAAETARFREALDYIERSFRKDATFIVLPEGIMLNYLSRRQNPTPYTDLVPHTLLHFGEERILESLSNGRPDYVILATRDLREFNVNTPFGVEIGREILAWVNRDYRPVARFGGDPRRSTESGIDILERIDTMRYP